MDDYIIYTEIGTGTDSVVFKGRKSGTLEYLALQSFDFRLSDKAGAKFLNASELEHPNILKIMKMADTSTRRWLVMEYCAGGDLLSLLTTDIRLDLPVIRQFALDLASGLQYCHTNGLIVRDLRPAKILVDNGWLKIGDLSAGVKLDKLGNVCSEKQSWYPESDDVAALYQAPEVIEHGARVAATMLSDFWSLGCILYEMFAGAPPFVSDDINVLHQLIRNGVMPLEPLDTAPPEFIELLDGLVCRSPATRMRWQRLCASSFFTALTDDNGGVCFEFIPTSAAEHHADRMIRNVSARTVEITANKPPTSPVSTSPMSAQRSTSGQSKRYAQKSTAPARDKSSTTVATTTEGDSQALLATIAARRRPQSKSMLPVRTATSVLHRAATDIAPPSQTLETLAAAPPPQTAPSAIHRSKQSQEAPLTVVEHSVPPLTVAEHSEPPLTVAELSEQPLTVAEHSEPPLTVPEQGDCRKSDAPADASTATMDTTEENHFGDTSVLATDKSPSRSESHDSQFERTYDLSDALVNAPERQDGHPNVSTIAEDAGDTVVDEANPADRGVARAIVASTTDSVSTAEATTTLSARPKTGAVEPNRRPASSRRSRARFRANAADETPVTVATAHAAEHVPDVPDESALTSAPARVASDVAPRSPGRATHTSRPHTATSVHHSQYTLKRENIVLMSDVQMDDLVFHDSDGMISPLVANPKIEKYYAPKYTGKYGSLRTIAPNRWVAMDIDTLRQHLIRIDECVAEGVLSRDNAGGSRGSRRGASESVSSHADVSSTHALSYLQAVCTHADVANIVANSVVFGSLIGCLRGKAVSDTTRERVAMVVGLLMRYATLIRGDVHMAEMMSALTDALRVHYRNVRLKRRLIAALGETMFYVASQAASAAEELPAERWKVPAAARAMVRRILKDDGDDVVTTHYAIKIVENVSSISGAHARAYATNEVGLLLWTALGRCNDAAVRRSAAWAVARVCVNTPSVLQHITDKAGAGALVDLLRDPSARVRQPILNCLLLAFMPSSPPLSRVQSALVDSAELLTNILAILERSPVVLRGKLYLLVAYLVRADESGTTFLRAAQSRLLHIMQRDLHRHHTPADDQSPTDASAAANDAYVLQCGQCVCAAVATVVPHVVARLADVVAAVSRRKRPTHSQVKEMRTHLDLLSGAVTAVQAQAVGDLVVSDSFWQLVATLLELIPTIDRAETDLSEVSATAYDDLVASVLALAESMVGQNNPNTVTDHGEPLIRVFLPAVVGLIATSALRETRLAALQIVHTALGLIMTRASLATATERSRLHHLVEGLCDRHLFAACPSMLHDDDPIPGTCARMLHILIVKHPELIGLVIAHHLGAPIVHLLQRYATGESRFAHAFGNGDVLASDAGAVAELDSESVVALVTALAVSPRTDLLQLCEHGLCTKLMHSIRAAAAHGEAGQDQLPLLLEIMLQILDRTRKQAEAALATNANTPSFSDDDEAGGGEDEMLESRLASAEHSLRLCSAFRPLSMFLLHTLAAIPAHEATIAGLRCIDMLLQLFGDEYAKLTSSQPLKSLQTILQAPLTSPSHKRCCLQLIHHAVTADAEVATMFSACAELRSTLETLAAPADGALSTPVTRSVRKLALEITSAFGSAC
eukprot:m.794700 g.794700  ORF g.794700 m.794700 type:complete len:1626 (+) comp23340_c0_seq1:451-5328(+)